MVTKEEFELLGTRMANSLRELEAKTIEAIELLGKVVTENFKFVNGRLTTMGEGNKLYLDLINERITELLETEDAILKQLVEPKPVKIAEDVDFEKTIRHASPGIEGSAAIKDIPKGDYIRYKDKHYELNAAPEIETEKGINLYIEGRGESFWFPKAAFEDTKYQMGLVKWYKVKSTHKWVLEKNGLIGEEE